MYLHPSARKFYDVAITTDTPVDMWRASFDGGSTWVDGEAVAGGFRWLVRGPAFTPTDAIPSALVATTMEPLLSYSTNPERDVERGPLIIVTPT